LELLIISTHPSTFTSECVPTISWGFPPAVDDVPNPPIEI